MASSLDDDPASHVADDVARAARAAEVLKAIGHPLRLRIVALLCNEKLHVNAIAERLDQNPTIVSQQLRILRMSHLVEADHSNGLAYYHLVEPQLRNVVRCLARCHG